MLSTQFVCAEVAAGGRAITANCEICAIVFSYPRPARGRPRKFCSDECRRVKFGGAWRHSNPTKPVSTAPCIYCGIAFQRTRGKQNNRYCGIKCSGLHRADKKRVHKDEAASVFASGSRRRARLAGVLHEEFTREEIYERDGWICGICHQPVDPGMKWPARMSATVDHIIPIHAKGDHLRSNVQCAHWLCNSRKTFRTNGGTRAVTFARLAGKERNGEARPARI